MSLRSRSKARLSCERLDERCLPAVSALFLNGSLSVVGDDFANNIVVRQGFINSIVVTNNNVVVPVLGGQPTVFNTRFVTVQGMGGGDVINTSQLFLPYARIELHGNGGNDTLIGGFGPESFFGGSGNDFVDANDGNDVIDGGTGDDRLLGGAGDDVIEGGEGNDQIDGGFGNDDLRGGFGNDFLFGNAGNDVLKGGPGSDRFQGGYGADTFITEGFELIFDFNPNEGDRVMIARW